MKNVKGSILIFALWTLALLAFLAAHVNLKIRHRINLLSRLEQRSTMHHISEAGVLKAVSMLDTNLASNQAVFTSYLKYFWHNNPEAFQEQKVGQGVFNVGYRPFYQKSDAPFKNFGVMDEESKINLNYADRQTLVDLFSNVTTIDTGKVDQLADAIISWRDFGSTQAKGFHSDEFYGNQAEAYDRKQGAFETLDELLLLEGMDEATLEKILPFVTIYGDGAVNINTATFPVLVALGFDPEFVDKFLAIRRGPDDIDATVDDFMFFKPYDLASDMMRFTELKLPEVQKIDLLNQKNKLRTSSRFYLVQSTAHLASAPEWSIRCIYDRSEKKIKYWREK